MLGKQMHKWAGDLFPIHRSLMGKGVRETLNYLQNINPNISIYEVPSGTRAFDWVVPNEWTIRDAYIEDMFGQRIISINDSNLHVMGYSIPINEKFTRLQLENNLYSLPDQPSAIPYITSYYQENWGFCLSQNQRNNLGEGPFNVVIDSELKPGSMTYGEVVLKGNTAEEVLISTYICHPSMANNELSGPVVTMALLNWLSELKERKYTYRFVFLPETIGAIYYISKHLKHLKKNVKAGWVLTCIGDDRSYSYLKSRNGKTLTDKISIKVLEDRGLKFNEYSFLDRGSDERQYCAPGVDLPVGSFMRSKYGEFPEYHTSLDDLNFVTPSGLQGGFEIVQDAISMLETNCFPKINTLGEPQLGKRGLYPNTSTKTSGIEVQDQMNVIAYSDGLNDLIAISKICKISYKKVLHIVNSLRTAGLLV
jgi:aminopeptidase-like protein